MPNAPTFRRATSADAALVAELAEQTFRDTFTAQNTAENMDALCASAYGEAIQRVEIDDPARETWLLCEGEQAVGYLMLRRAAAPACIGGALPVEILRFYLRATHHGQGLAQPMMAHALVRCAAMGGDCAWLGVWERNPRAIRFYEREGFEVVGSHIFHVGDDPQTDLLLRRPL